MSRRPTTDGGEENKTRKRLLQYCFRIQNRKSADHKKSADKLQSFDEDARSYPSSFVFSDPFRGGLPSVPRLTPHVVLDCSLLLETLNTLKAWRLEVYWKSYIGSLALEASHFEFIASVLL